MTQHPFRFTFFLLMCLVFPLTAMAQVVSIPDPNLRAAVEIALGKASGATITTDEMVTLTRLEASWSNISDLTGLEGATNLRYLYLRDNSISDISPIAKLAKLMWLHLEENSITDISPVTGLTNLGDLYLRDNSISDISPVIGLTNLRYLWR